MTDESQRLLPQSMRVADVGEDHLYGQNKGLKYRGLSMHSPTYLSFRGIPHYLFAFGNPLSGGLVELPTDSILATLHGIGEEVVVNYLGAGLQRTWRQKSGRGQRKS